MKKKVEIYHVSWPGLQAAESAGIPVKVAEVSQWTVE